MIAGCGCIAVLGMRELHEIDMAVPLSPNEVLLKRNAFFYHQSQKDRVMYQGNDSREFG
jgi:glucosamine-6-phosphate deaminase